MLNKDDLILPNGYINMPAIIEKGNTFIFIFGARGTGKTWGALEYCYRMRLKFIYMRRTQTQLNLISIDDTNPFKSIDEAITVKPVRKEVTGVYLTDEEGKPSGAPIGYMMALSTIANVRGFDMSDIDVLIFDEFEGEAHERRIKAEDSAFFNAYETINRNRELIGRKPLKAVLMANSNDMAVPIILAFKLVHDLENMARKGQSVLNLDERDISLVLMSLTPISEKKAQTALYKAVGSGTFTDMAINNRFSANDLTNVTTRSFKEYKPLVQVGEIFIYQHKDRRDYYISPHKHGSFNAIYDADTVSLKKWRKDYYILWLAHLNKLVFFEGYTEKVLFERYFNIGL